MRQLQLSQLDETEEEKEARLRKERALRMMGMAKRAGYAGGVSLARLTEMPPLLQAQILGLPPSVWLDEMRRLELRVKQPTRIAPSERTRAGRY